MKRLLVLGLALVVLASAAAFSNANRTRTPSSELKVEVAQQNPWTHLRLNNNPEAFQFAIVSDRTGGHRAKIFSQAVQRLNLMQPEFVVSVGDLIEGYTEDKTRLLDEWKEFDSYVKQLEMPFFYVPGNHDITNAFQEKAWQERYGRSYYHFVYRDILFLAVNSEDPPGKGGSNVSDEQVAYFKKALEENKDVRWTIAMLHKPMWVYNNGATNGWGKLEELLKSRKYTVFAGHVHRFEKFVRNGMNYYQLATTGGGSKLRGVRYGEFDHIVWVTMKNNGPRLANVMLEGIYPEDLSPIPSEEAGVRERPRQATYPVKGRVVWRGKPIANAAVVLHSYSDATMRYRRVADGLTDAEGSYSLTTYSAFDGAPKGEYVVTVAVRPSDKLPMGFSEKFTKPETSLLKLTVREESSAYDLKLE